MIWDNYNNESIPWLRGPVQDSIFLSTRIRFARNLTGYNFKSRIYPSDLEQLYKTIKKALENTSFYSLGKLYQTSRLLSFEKKYLIERHLISSDLSRAGKYSGAFIYESDSALSILINEEDHLRISQVFSSTQLEDCYIKLSKLYQELAGKLDYAYSSRWGYLTACPTNCGTGMRVSFLCHLPGIVSADEFEGFQKGLTAMDLSLRGFYGEGSQAYGNIFQIYSNKSLGLSEKALLKSTGQGLEFIREKEFEAREKLKSKSFFQLEDAVWRTVGIIKYARAISSTDALRFLSTLWLGYSLGILNSSGHKSFPPDLFILVQPVHLQLLLEEPLSAREMDVFRAQFIRKQFRDETWYREQFD
ncbi:hypothetical protein JW877_06145 [bacterium]|nr:hypothetical protein [bacterium]